MKRSNRDPKPRRTTRELSKAQLDQVKGGALNAYLNVTGSTQGTVEGDSDQGG